MNVQQQLDSAIAHHSAGRLDQAEPIYRQMLADNPNEPRALHLLGVLLSQRGDKEQAVRLITRAIEINPGAAEYHSNLGLVFLEQGRPEPAVMSCRRSIELNPRDAEAHFILGNALREIGRAEEAVQMYQRALELKPSHGGAMRNLALLLKVTGRAGDALGMYRQLLKQRPDWPEALIDYGEILRGRGQLADALAAFDRAIALQPAYAAAHNGRGLVLHDMNDTDAAAASYRRGAELDPTNAGIRANLGYALELQGKFDESVAELERAVALRPDLVDAVGNLGNSYRDVGRWADADAQYVRGLRLQPDSFRVRFNRALLLLLLGRFEEGWTEYEWRWLLFPQHRRTFLQPRWLDADVSGKTVLLYAEQGLGDTIQFARYAPLVAQRGARVILECHAELHPLLRDLPGVAQCCKRGETLPSFDFHAPLLSLPLSFRTFSTDAIPRDVPYLKADAAKAQAWRERLSAEPARLRVGIAWAGDPTHRFDLVRSCTLKQFAPLADLDGVVFYSLQKGARAAKPGDAPAGMTFIDYTDDIKDFADTAALMSNLDLIISVDTSIVHMAGALGRPVFTLLPFNPDFRWLLDRSDSPWYPTMKLFRPPKPRDWDAVFAEVKMDLAAMLAQQPANSD
jgi:tetratricopeptide (TPR) repeat protein